MTEIRYRTNGRESVRQTAEDWADVCNNARKHLFPEVTAEQIAEQSRRADEIMGRKSKRKGRA